MSEEGVEPYDFQLGVGGGLNLKILAHGMTKGAEPYNPLLGIETNAYADVSKGKIDGCSKNLWRVPYS